MMTTNRRAIGIIASTLKKYSYPESYLQELVNFLELNQSETELTTKTLSQLQHILYSLSIDVPVEYLVGSAVFYDRRFIVNRSVLIPRFDTEALVRTGIEYVNNLSGESVTIIDIGTGSGAIIISLALELGKINNVAYWAIDISNTALHTAQINAKHHNVLQKITFSQADTFPRNDTGFPKIPASTNVLLITNPPYISEEHFKLLPASVKNYEPIIALKEQSTFIEKLELYLSRLLNEKKNIGLLLEFNNQKGEMEQYSFLPYTALSNLNSFKKKSS